MDVLQDRPQAVRRRRGRRPAALPTDDDLANLYECWHDKQQEPDWHCLGGCGFTVAESQADQITDHVRDCDLVNAAGTPIS